MELGEGLGSADAFKSGGGVLEERVGAHGSGEGGAVVEGGLVGGLVVVVVVELGEGFEGVAVGWLGGWWGGEGGDGVVEGA